MFPHFRHKLLRDFYRLSCKHTERNVIGRGETADDNIDIAQQWNDLRPGQLTQASSKTVSLDDSVTMLGNDNGHSCMRKQGVGCPNIEVLGTNPSPCFFYYLEI